jgi:hypothetical protein
VVCLTVPSKLETHAITSHALSRERRPKSESRLKAEAQRAELLQRLELEDADDLSTPLGKCGERDELTCTCCGERWEIFKRCNRKWCPVCQRALSTRAALRYTGICSSFQWPLFVTLTCKNYDDLAVDVIRHMRRSFGKLRRLRWWNKAVTGGVAGLEITNTGKGWHPHLHMLLDCKWLAVSPGAPAAHVSAEQKKRAYARAGREIQEQWSLCLGRQGGVKTKRAKAGEDAKGKGIAAEIIKYSVKGSDLLEFKGNLAPVLRMLDGTRLLTSFGTAYGHLRDWDQPKQPTACSECGNTGQWVPSRTAMAMMRFNR